MDQRAEVARAIRRVFDNPSRSAADLWLKEIVAHYATGAPKLATWMEENLPQGFTVFALPGAHQKRLRTSNPLEPSTKNSNGEPASPGSSPMKPPSCRWSPPS